MFLQRLRPHFCFQLLLFFFYTHSKNFLNNKKLPSHILTADRCLVALHWERQVPLSSIELYARIKAGEIMESLTACLADMLAHHNTVWEPWHSQEDPPMRPHSPLFALMLVLSILPRSEELRKCISLCSFFSPYHPIFCFFLDIVQDLTVGNWTPI